jgi:antitoxin (DNA-binding transcriptional repressor) of toxin-antitoxin stability system
MITFRYCVHKHWVDNRSASWDYVRRGWVVTLTVATVAVAALIPAGRAGTAAAATSRPAPSRLAAIPASYLTWYVGAARTCHGLAWEVLAAIGTMESDNGRSTAHGVRHGKNRKGAEGPMQFEPATFAEYAVRADRSHKLSPYDPEDAIFSAARLLCHDGGGSARGLKGAIFAYNHARRYVRDVLALAARYTAAARAGHRRRARHRRRR